MALPECGGCDLALAAFAALELDQLERVVELASRIEGPTQANGIRDYLLGSVLARRGHHEQAVGLHTAQASMDYDEANAFAFVYYLLALRGVEALPAPAGVVTPQNAQPVLVSIIVPAFNKWIFTLNCLRSLVVDHYFPTPNRNR